MMKKKPQNYDWYEGLRAKKEARIADEYGKPFEEVLKDLSKEMSFTLACKTLKLTIPRYKKYKHLFKPKFVSEETKRKNAELHRKIMLDSAVKYLEDGSKSENGKTVKQWSQETGISEQIIRRRIHMGMFITDEYVNPKQRVKNRKTVATKETALWNLAFFGVMQ